MTGYVENIGVTPLVEMYWNGPIELSPQNDLWTWFRSLNTQEWLGPFSLVPGSTFVSNARYTKWFVDLGSIPNIGDQHRNGFYQFCTTLPFGPTDKPTVGIQKQGLIKLVFSSGGELGVTEYISNNEQREADTYFRPNY
jgi:hypothetical protein